ncbi:Uma2 family endonuclease [Gemmata sp. JC717]|uniref:Uma2 family endonuclease n=1 Tax=Gemmata algarum TaxID=2975278 RepID=UPI0021BA59CE|nr:Uma2 family endonuclease [Gemmata algarum]MDY3551752.1 Uma2 family endonuclease [Gemmata algarum]
MSAITTTPPAAVEYPDSDGQPVAENTLQFEWIVTLKGNIDLLFRDRDDVFVAGDHLIYPVEGDNTTRQAPDVYVAFGRPKGHRGSYRVWDEGGVFPQVVFEVLSPGNRAGEMNRKRAFYRKYGVEEYYTIDPDDHTAEGVLRDGDTFREVPDMNGFVSPLLGIRFEVVGGRIRVLHPDGRPFLSFVELGERERETAERARNAERRAEAARQKAERLAARLRELGVDPDAV